MATITDFKNKIAVKIKALALAVKENEIIFLGGKEKELMKQQGFIEKLLCEINDLKNQGQENNVGNRRG